MAPFSSRPSFSVSRRRRPAKSVTLRCEQFEDKVTPATFNVPNALSFTGITNVGCVAVADLNKDTFMDAVLTNYGGDGTVLPRGNSITILYGRLGGGFNRIERPTGGTNPSFAAIADINGDTWADIVVSNGNAENTGSVSVFSNDGAGNMSLSGSPFASSGNNTSWVGLVDVTGDQILDVITCSFGKAVGENVTGANITIFQGNVDAQGKGNFTFSAGPIANITPGIQFVPTALAVADFDGDNIVDIAAAVPGVPPDFNQPQPNGSVYVFKGTGSGGFSQPTQYDTGGALPVNIQTADLNGDGKRDLIVANAGDPNASPEFKGNGVGVILNVSTTGNLNFGITNTLAANAYGTFAIAAADYNKDGKTDIAAVNYGSQTGLSPNAFVSVFMGNGLGTFTPDTPGTYDTRTNLPGGQYLAAGDFDNNGSTDLIVAHASNLVGMLVNTTSAQPTVSSVGVDNGTIQRSAVRSLTVTFSGQVSFVGPASAAFQLRQNGSSTNIPVTVDLTGSTATQTIAKLTFSGSFTEGSPTNPTLKDGNYTLTVLSAQITGGLGGGDNVSSVYRLYGDVNGDRAVNGLDLATFRTAFGTSTGNPNYVDYLDFNGDGAINGLDLADFRTRFGTTLAP
jgi:hypothetical protein